MNRKWFQINITVFVLFFAVIPGYSQFYLDAEGGAAFSGYNDIRIPGDGGDQFSAYKELSPRVMPFARLRAGYIINKRHDLSGLINVINLKYEGQLNRTINFNGTSFPAFTPLNVQYKFNNYRFTYRYHFVAQENIVFGAGLTVFVRDAAIKVEGGGLSSTRSNIGPVPLINLKLDWRFSKYMGLFAETDFLFSKRGRAEDFSIALQFYPDKHLKLRLGYRLIEGGSDGSVYNFTLIHFLSFAITFILE